MLEEEFEKLDKVVREKTSALRREKDNLNIELTPLVNQHKLITSKIENLKSEIESCQSKSEGIQAEINKNNSSLNEFNNKYMDAQ